MVQSDNVFGLRFGRYTDPAELIDSMDYDLKFD